MNWHICPQNLVSHHFVSLSGPRCLSQQRRASVLKLPLSPQFGEVFSWTRFAFALWRGNEEAPVSHRSEAYHPAAKVWRLDLRRKLWVSFLWGLGWVVVFKSVVLDESLVISGFRLVFWYHREFETDCLLGICLELYHWNINYDYNYNSSFCLKVSNILCHQVTRFHSYTNNGILELSLCRTLAVSMPCMLWGMPKEPLEVPQNRRSFLKNLDVKNWNEVVECSCPYWFEDVVAIWEDVGVGKCYPRIRWVWVHPWIFQM